MKNDTPFTAEESRPRYVIEGARSGRSRCKSCRRTIAKGALRIGILVDGPFGEGYLWHHLGCLARTRLKEVERAYELEAWTFAKTAPKNLPTLAELSSAQSKAKRQREQRRRVPYLEIAPSGRSRCKLCGANIAEGSVRVVLGREVSFGQQVRTAPVKVHPGCVQAELARDDSAVETDGLEQALRTNSEGMEEAVLEAALAQVTSA
jgi:hypothetical protein